MSKITQINIEIRAAAPTLINSELAGGISGGALEKGVLIGGKYCVEERIKAASGEAELYLCSFEGGQYVAKIYRREAALREEVTQALEKIDSPFVARPLERIEHDGAQAEILPYFPNGSLQGVRFNLDQLRENVIPQVNEGIETLHGAGILHKDIKPSNIMRGGQNLALIDFGVSSVMNDGRTVLVSKTGMTPEYAAPETFKNVYLAESDYYSFGITLYELFCGYTPYANMSSEEIEQYVSVQRIPYPEDMPMELQELISGLTYYDVTNRNDPDNPNRRWTGDEVRRWLAGEKLPIPGEGAGSTDMPPFEFRDAEYTEISGLVRALADHWEAGKRLLFRGELTKYFRSWSIERARACLEAEEEAARTNGRDDTIFWKLLYRLDSEMQGFCWRGLFFEGLPALGRDMLERLWDGDQSQYLYYEGILGEKILSQFTALIAPQNEDLQKAAQAIEDSWQIQFAAKEDMRRTYYLMAYTLSGQKLFRLGGEQFRTVGELAGYMRELLDESLENFERLCHRLVDYDGNLDVQLEAWLIAIGKQEELDRWRRLMNE